MRPLYPNPNSLLSSSSPTRTPILFLLLQHQPPPPSRGFRSLSTRLRQQHPLQEEEEGCQRQVKVSVWWDFENCGVPPGTNFFRVGPAITAAVRANHIRGPVEITAFGDILLLSRLNQECLSSTGINLTHIPRSGKNRGDQSLVLNLMHWVSHNPPPAHLFLISGDKELAGTLHRLRMNNYNILLATPESTHGVLRSATSIMWNWYDLLCGENLVGKYFNQPPDGPYSSWYGQYKMPLLDPFSADVEQPACLQLEESSESSSDVKPQLVPKSVREHIRRIVESNSEGISITDLRTELASIMKLDKDYYGYKKFGPLLLSLENIVKLSQVKPGHFIVHGIAHNAHDCKDEDVNAVSEVSCDKRIVKDTHNKTSLTENLGSVSSSPPFNLNGKDMLITSQKNLLGDQNATKMANSPAGHLPPRENNNVETLVVEKVAVDKKIVETIGVEKFVETVSVDEKIVEMIRAPESDNHFPPGDERVVETVNVPESSIGLPSVEHQESSSEFGFRRVWSLLFRRQNLSSDFSSGKDDERLEGKDSDDSKSMIGFSDSEPSSLSSSFGEQALENTKPGFLDRVQDWFKSRSEVEKLSRRSFDEENLIIRDSGHELFSKDSFWSTVQSFMDTSQGSLIVSESTSREHMAHEFQRKGPECLQSLGESELLHLVKLLISEKKLVEECPSEVFPFKLTRVGKSSESESCHDMTSNSLSSLFISPSSHSGTKGLPNREEGEAENCSGAVEEKLPVRSRDEIVAECQSLVNEIMKEITNGDTSNAASSENTTPSGSSLSNASTNSDGHDLLRKELGLAAFVKSGRNRERAVEANKLKYDFSDSNEIRPINNVKLQTDSSLLAVFDSWPNRAEGDLKTNKSKTRLELIDLMTDPPKKQPDNAKANSGVVYFSGTTTQKTTSVLGRKQKRPPKNISFVSDDTTKELANTILGSILGNESSKNDKDKAFRQ